MTRSENHQPFAVVFDMDGVIVDSNPAHKLALIEFSHQHGYDLTDDEMKAKIYGRTNKDWIPNLLGNSLTEEQILQYEDEKESLFRKIYESDIKPVNGLVPFLRQLDEYNVPRAIATSAPRANVDFTLEKTGIGSFFQTILDESHVTVGKPHPEIYLKTAEALGLPPGQCIVIEDSISGVEAARRAGCKVVGITTTHTPEEFDGTDKIINAFNDLSVPELKQLMDF